EAGNASCNNIVPMGQRVQEMNNAGAMPSPMGGAVVPGTYVLTAWTHYQADAGAGATGSQSQTTFMLTANSVQSGEQLSLFDGGCAIRRQNGSLAFAGNMVTYTGTCPVCDGGRGNCGGGTTGYTSTSTI